MSRLLLLSNIILGVLLGAAAWRIWIQRRWVKWTNGELGVLSTPIPPIELEELDPVFEWKGPGPVQSEVRMFGGAVLGGTSAREVWILSALAKGAGRMFEFGTATGRTAYLWALNSAADARVVTLTLAADQVAAYRHAEGDTGGAQEHAIRESMVTAFYYTGTPEEEKITQLYGDSKQFDCEPYSGQFELIFIDGSHAYSYVKSDTEKALRMVKPGGLILWHDYVPHREELEGVYSYLNELRRTLPLRRLPQTRLVAYRVPAAAHLATSSADGA
jgi:hypothetical protein